MPPPKKRSSVSFAKAKRERERNRKRRARLTEEERLLLRKRDTERQRQRRAQLPQEALALRRQEQAARNRERRARLSKEEIARQRKLDTERQRKKRASEKQELISLHRAENTIGKIEHRKLVKEGLTLATNQNDANTQTVIEIRKLKISTTALKKATLEIIRSSVESAVSAKYYGTKGGKRLLKTSKQRKIQRKTPTKTGTFKKRRPSKNSYKELFPIPIFIDSQQRICIVCKEEFNSERSLTGHLSMHSVSELFGAKEKHMSTPVEDSPQMKIQYLFLTVYKCELCSDHCYPLNKYRKHIIEKHRDNREFVEKICFPCSFCDEIFIQRTFLVVHQRDFHGIFTQCPICKENFESQELFAKHLNEKHSNYVKKDEIVLEYNDGFFCKICGHCNRNSRHVFSHSKEVHSEISGSYSCSLCKQNYDTKKLLKIHMVKVHEERLFCCEVCGSRFGKENDLTLHKRRHATQSENKIECKECGKNFANGSSYKVHQLAVHEKKRLSCKICGKTFTCRSTLDQHKIIVCEKEKANPKTCPICDKVLANYVFLSHHKTNIHKYGNTEENACHLCKKTFKDSFGLLGHNRHHHQIKNQKSDPNFQLRCAICQKISPSTKNLLIHWRMHREEKPFKCNLCEATFKYTYQFYAHRKSDHEFERIDAELITDREMDNKIKDDWKNAHAPLLAYLKNRNKESTSQGLIDNNYIQEKDLANKVMDSEQISDAVILTDSLEGIQVLPYSEVEITYEEPMNSIGKSYVDFSRANVPVLEIGQVEQEESQRNCARSKNSIKTSDENLSKQISSLPEDSHANKMMNTADDDSDFDDPSSPMEFSDGEFSTEETKPIILDQDPFEKCLVVKVERLKECLLCKQVFPAPDLYEKHMNSKNHRVAVRAHKKETILMAKNEKMKRKHENHEILESQCKHKHKFLSCPLCNEKLESLEKYRQHSVEHKRQAYCLLCTEKFPTLQNLVDHYISEHDGKNIVKCDVCDMKFLEYQERSLQQHIRDTHGRNKNNTRGKVSWCSCDICGDEIRGRKLLWIHLLTHNDDEYKCLVCQEKLNCVVDLECHYNEVHNGQMPFSCENCSHQFSTQFQLNVHEKEDHAKSGREKIMRTQKKNKETDVIFPCPFCDLKFTILEKYNSHTIQHRKRADCLLCEEKFHTVRKLVDHYTSEHNGENIVKCKVCDKGFLEYRPKNLREHMTYTHGKKYQKKENKKLYTCHLCGEKRNNHRLFRDHLLSHNDTRHKCFYCLKEFNQIELEKHYTDAHNGEIPFSCGVCLRKFSTEERLKLHEKEFHPEEKNSEDCTKNKFVCDECGKGFKSKSEITDHKLSHVPLEDRNKFFCEFCGKSFLRAHSLTIHRREHTGEKPYPCKDCDMAFASPALLKQHVDCSHNQNSQTCELCGKSFNRRKNLVHHIKVHHSNVGKPSISCELCPEKFTKAEFLKKHLETLHNPSRPFGCDHCSCRFNHKSNLKLHIKGVHEKTKVCPKKTQFESH